MKSLKLFEGSLSVVVSCIVIIAAATVISTLLGSCRNTQVKPNIVIVLIDTLRADHCSLYGYSKNTTPHMRRIAQKGLTLENYFANAPWTKPSVASIITGLYPTAHGSRVGQFEQIGETYKGKPVVEILKEQVNTLPEILHDNGYETYAFVSNFHLTPEFGYAQGYDHYQFDPENADSEIVCGTDRDSITEIMDVLENDRETFIWCHLMSVHEYSFPGDFDRFHPQTATPIPATAAQANQIEDYKTIEEAVCAYDNSVLYVDKLVGDLFDFIQEEAPNTILIVTSDHGEEFYEHGGFEHCRTLYNEIIKVPCIMYGPGVPTGVLSHLVDSIDLMPTILTLVDIKPAKNLKGQTLIRQNKITADKNKEIFAEQHHRGAYRRFALIKDGKKMIVNRHKKTGDVFFEFYKHSLGMEKQDAAKGTDKTLLKEFKKKIIYYRKMSKLFFKKNIGKRGYKELSEEDIKNLRSLGYIQ